MKRICVIHGVGYEENMTSAPNFAAKLTGATGAACMPYLWAHPGVSPPDPRRSWLFPSIRGWVQEVIMDFAHVARNLADVVPALPDADMYVGHSAGGVIAAALTDRPVVLMGCPVQLLRNVEVRAARANVLNIMHYRDPIAAPVEGALNVVIYKPAIWSWLNPVAAHTSYWRNKAVMEHILGWYAMHVEELS